jgi:hypothetical protein
MSKDEKDNILDQHKHLYDGYVTKYNQESNQTPIYVQDLANDKMGVTLDNKGNVKNYTNFRVNESPLDRIADGPMDLKNGTIDVDSVISTDEDNTEFMHDVLPSPNEDEFDYETFGKFSDEMEANKDRFEFDIDELEDYSSEQMNETYDDDMEPEFEGDGEEEEIVGTVPDFDWLRTHQSDDEDEDLSDIVCLIIPKTSYLFSGVSFAISYSFQ